MHPCFGRVKQCLCCNSWEWPAREAAPKLVSTSCSPWIANCQKMNTACKNLQHLSPRPAHLVALKALPQGSHHKSLWDSSVVNLCEDWAESSVMAPSTVSRADEITNASEIFFICKTANPLDCQQVQNEAPVCQIWETACISEQKPDLSVSHATASPSLGGNEKFIKCKVHSTMNKQTKKLLLCWLIISFTHWLKHFFLGQEWLVSLFWEV